jgi:hypothetical protein
MTSTVSPRPFPTRAENPGYAVLWFGFLGAAAAWSIQELVAYTIVAHTCYPNTDPLTAPHSGIAWPFALGISVAALLVSLLSLGAAWRQTARTIRDTGDYGLASADSHRTTARAYLSFGGVLFGAIFTALIVYNIAALIFQPACTY